MLSRYGSGPLLRSGSRGELGGVRDVRLLHYVFLTEPPLTSTLFLRLSPAPHSSAAPSSLSLSSFPSPSAFSILSRCPPRTFLSNECPPPSRPTARAEVSFFRERANLPPLITRPVRVGERYLSFAELLFYAYADLRPALPGEISWERKFMII